MKVKYEASFAKDLKNIKDKKVLQKVKAVVENVKIATKPAVNHLKN